MYEQKKIDLLKKTVCNGLTDVELELFLHACQRTQLDPFMRQIHAVKRKQFKDGDWIETMTIQVGIDGYRLLAERTEKYAPGAEPSYTYSDKKEIVSCTVSVKKQTADGTWHDVRATAFMQEYCQKNKKGELTAFWHRMGHTMLAKCAEALALRKAFPAELSGIYTHEEMMQADRLEEVVSVSEEKQPTCSAEQWQELIETAKNSTQEIKDGIRSMLKALGAKSANLLTVEEYQKIIAWVDKEKNKAA